MEIIKLKRNSEEWSNFKKENDIHTENFKYFSWSEPLFQKENILIIIIKVDNQVVAVGEIQDILNTNELGVSFISCHPEHRGKGYAKQIVKQMFLICKEENKALRMSSYSHQGFWTIRPVALKCSKDLCVELKENGLVEVPYTEAEDIFFKTMSQDLAIYKFTNLVIKEDNPYFDSKKCMVPHNVVIKQKGMFSNIIAKNQALSTKANLQQEY